MSKVGKHFINPCCFGEDLAAWLRIKLAEKNWKASEAYQEDWGWELPVRHGKDYYYLCMSGNRGDSGVDNDEGEWRIIVEKRRSIWQRVTGKGKIAENDALLLLVKEILSGEATIRDVHRA